MTESKNDKSVKKIPKRFYDDCIDCDTLVPPIVRETQSHYFVDISQGDSNVPGATAAETMDDFISRAEEYSDEFGFDSYVRGICKSAGATLRALGKHEPLKIKELQY
jgi:hypothetical protein